jgi:hypothetical protein
VSPHNGNRRFIKGARVPAMVAPERKREGTAVCELVPERTRKEQL